MPLVNYLNLQQHVKRTEENFKHVVLFNVPCYYQTQTHYLQLFLAKVLYFTFQTTSALNTVAVLLVNLPTKQWSPTMVL